MFCWFEPTVCAAWPFPVVSDDVVVVVVEPGLLEVVVVLGWPDDDPCPDESVGVPDAVGLVDVVAFTGVAVAAGVVDVLVEGAAPLPLPWLAPVVP